MTTQDPPPYPTHAYQRPGTQLASLGRFIFALGIFAGIAAVAGGIALATHTVTTCTNPFDANICDTTAHPFTATGISLIIGGIVEAIVICTVGRLAQIVSELRAALARTDRV